MLFEHLICGGCGSTTVSLDLNEKTFTLWIYYHWMGGNSLNAKVCGHVKNNGSNYYMCVTESIDRAGICLECSFAFEVVVLTTAARFYKEDAVTEFLTCAGSAIFNNEEGSFDAIIFYDPNPSIIQLHITDRILKLINHCKLAKVSVLRFDKSEINDREMQRKEMQAEVDYIAAQTEHEERMKRGETPDGTEVAGECSIDPDNYDESNESEKSGGFCDPDDYDKSDEPDEPEKSGGFCDPDEPDEPDDLDEPDEPEKSGGL
jgi:hypothetical protein